MADNTALISVEEITISWLLKAGMTGHVWWRILPFACEAVQELTLTTLPIVHHVIIQREPGQNYFKLPEGFVDWVSVGRRVGEHWRPVNATNNLLPFLNRECSPTEYSNEYSDKFRKKGHWKSWLNHECRTATSDFFSGDFFNDNFSTTDTTTTQDNGNNEYSFYDRSLFPFFYNWFGVNSNGEYTKGYLSDAPRADEVAFNVEKKMIVCGTRFPTNQLYLVYVGRGAADTMTHIPITAQACIESYIDWKYELKRRNNIGNAREMERLYRDQHRLLRARLSKFTTQVMRRIMNKGYNVPGSLLGGGYGAYVPENSGHQTQVIYVNPGGIDIYASAGTYAEDERLSGKTTEDILYVVVNGLSLNTGYYVDGDMLIFNNGTTFIGGEKISVIYA